MTPLNAVRAGLIACLAVLFGTPAVARQPDDAVTVNAQSAKERVRPGEQFPIAIVLDHAPGFHTWPNKPVLPDALKDVSPTPSTVEAVSHDPRLKVHAEFAQWPQPQSVETAAFSPQPVKVLSYTGRAVVYVPVVVAANATPGAAKIELKYSYLACNDSICLMPQEVELSIPIEIDPAGAEAGTLTDAGLFSGFDQSVWARIAAAPSAPSPTISGPAPGSAKFDFFGLSFTSSSVIAILLVAALGGFILNLTPCVLPVVPLKVMALQQSAGHHPGRRILLGTSMFLGVAAFWIGLGLLIVSLKVFKATNELFGNPYFLLIVGVFIGFMALGMMGAFVIRLPQQLYLVNPSHDTLPGSFGFGIVTAILGTPCFGPFAGAAAGWATTQPPTIGLAAFAAVGAGMGLPYLILAIWPGLLGFVPRTGPASELVKQVMGLLLFAAAVFFFGIGLMSLVAEAPYLSTVLHWWGVAAFGAAAGGWLVYRTFKITPSAGRRVLFTAVGVLVAGLGLGWANWQTRIARETYVPQTARNDGLWKDYTETAFAAARDAGHVIVIDFTADWCINCKVIEALVLNKPDVQAALGSSGVVAMKADLTSRKAPGWAKMAELHEVGIPLLAITGPGLPSPWKSNAYSPAQVIATIKQARPAESRSASAAP
jgi:thiol:disulfide interchange protein DsbD